MAIIPESQYPGKIAPASTEYPYGQARNITLPGDGTGTPWEAALVNDLFGLQQSLLSEADITPSGDPEQVGASQYLSALFKIHGAVVESVTALKEKDLPAGRSVYLTEGRRGGRFIVKSGVPPADPEEGIYIPLDNGNYAERVFSGYANAGWFGASSSLADNRDILIAALETYPYIEVTEPLNSDPTRQDGAQTYGGVEMPSNSTLKFSGAGELIAVPNEANEYSIISVFEKENVRIIRPRLIGDRDDHTGTTGEFGHGIYIGASTNVTVDDPDISKCWGDGIYIGTNPGGSLPSKNITIDRPVCDENRRQGISVVSVIGLEINDPVLKNTSGTSPAAGIDFEPNGPNDFMEGVFVKNLKTENNVGGGLIIAVGALTSDPANQRYVSITIDGHLSDGDYVGGSFTNCRNPSTGIIQYNSPVVKNSGINGIFVRNWDKDGISVLIQSPKIINPNRDQVLNDTDGVGISVYRVGGDTVTTGIGNVTVIDPSVMFETGFSSPVTAKYEMRADTGGVRNSAFLQVNNLVEADFSASTYPTLDRDSVTIQAKESSDISEINDFNGFPVGGVVASGSDGNRQYVMYRDGTLIQTISGILRSVQDPAGSVFLSSGGSDRWVFLVPFVDPPEYVTSGVGSGGVSDNAAVWGGRARLITASNCYLVVFAATAITDTVEITGFAKGRWY